jgi:hypothetical protein
VGFDIVQYILTISDNEMLYPLLVILISDQASVLDIRLANTERTDPISD